MMKDYWDDLLECRDEVEKLREAHNALDRAARYYREALAHIIEECDNDKPRIAHIREAAERGLRAADHELAVPPPEEPQP